MRKKKKKSRSDKSELILDPSAYAALVMCKRILESSLVETGLTHPFLWMSGKSENVEAAGRVFFLLPDLSRKIERDCSQASSENKAF